MTHVAFSARHAAPVYAGVGPVVRALFVIAFALAACHGAPAAPDAPSSPWRVGPTKPTPRIEAGVTALGQRVVVAGGFYMAAPLPPIATSVDVFDSSSTDAMHPLGTWLAPSPFPDIPMPLHHVQLAAIGTTLYLLGGLGETSTSFPAEGSSWSLDTSTTGSTWQAIATMPSGAERGSAGIIVAPPRIYLIGGASTTSALPDIIYYDITQDAWCPNPSTMVTCQAFPPLPVALSHVAAARRLDGAFVVVGGLAGLTADTAVDTAYLLTVDQQNMTGAWNAKSPMPAQVTSGLSSARGGCAYGLVGGQVVCAGGEGAGAFHLVQSYDPINDAWAQRCDMPAARAGAQGAAIGERLFVPGGSLSLPPIYEPEDSLFVFAPLDTTTCS